MTNIRKNTQANFQAALLALALERGGAQSLVAQLSEALRRLILSDLAAPGLRLPPTRVLAAELSVSRATALSAIEQLKAEGYLEARQGAGTYVAANLPHLSAPAPAAPKHAAPSMPRRALQAFEQGPDVRRFPHRDWARHLEAAWARPQRDLLAPADPAGWAPLRAAIARHLSAWRAIKAEPARILITSGAAESFALIARLARAGDVVATEAPAFAPLLDQIERAALRAQVFPVDAEGFDPGHLTRAHTGVVVTPSRQFPLGMTLPLGRRLALLDWAERTGGIIVEDDYDSEFRYEGAPLPALASLRANARVFYVGSFSKLLTPSLRLGYLVVPEVDLEKMRALIARRGPQASLVPQPALARFMDSGAFATHLRRMRRLYAQRYAALLGAVETRFVPWLTPVPHPSGMHLFCRPGPALRGWSDAEIARRAGAAGVNLGALSRYPAAEQLGVGNDQGFVLGFAAHEDSEMHDALDRLRGMFEALAGAPSDA